MRHNQPQWKSMVSRERLPVMMRGQQHIVTIQVRQRNICRITLFRMDQDKLCFRLGLAPASASP